MKEQRGIKVFLSVVLIISFFMGMPESQACTGVLLKAEDGNYVFARTLEFSSNVISYDIVFVPRKQKFIGHTPTGEPGLEWETKYAHMGFNPSGVPLVGEGLNEKGLACGLFFFPGYAGYQQVTDKNVSKTISCIDLPAWILSTCANVTEVRERLPEINVCGVVVPEWGYAPPLHYFVADESGDAAVIEYIDGKLNIHDNEVNVITNSPNYDWHTTNLRNYIGLRPDNDPAVKIDGKNFSQFGQGSGAKGLPGDFTPPSRFIRAAFLVNTMYPGKNAEEEVKVAFHLLNQFDIPSGAVRAVQKDGTVQSEATQWTSAADLTNRRYYFHTFNDRTVRMLDLKELDPNAPGILTIKNLEAPGKAIDITEKFKSVDK